MFCFFVAFLILLQCVDVDVELLNSMNGDNDISGWMDSATILIKSNAVSGITI